jgi:hypothetical protein
MKLHTELQLLIIDDQNEIRRVKSSGEKPFLRLIDRYGQITDITLNIGEAIGAVARGAKQRFGIDQPN